MTNPDETIQTMRAQVAAFWKVRVIEFTRLEHAKAVHKCAGPAIPNCGKGNDLCQIQQLKSSMNRGFRAFEGEPFSPVISRQAPADLHTWSEWKFWRWSVQANETDEVVTAL
jgi:hypothetical protein